MASASLSIVAADSGLPATDPAISTERAIYRLLEPLKAPLSGSDAAIHVLGMRDISAADLPLLDQYQGQPIALAHAMVAALCGVTADQVRQLNFADLAMLASDALWQVEQACIAMGLPPHHFLQAGADE